MFSTSFLLASLIWGSVGLGYFIYGKRQGSWAPMVGGVLMMALSYFVASALLMTLACMGLMAGVYVMLKRGY
jgi:predicted phage tail protein